MISSIFSKWNTNPWPQDLFPYLPGKLPFFCISTCSCVTKASIFVLGRRNFDSFQKSSGWEFYKSFSRALKSTVSTSHFCDRFERCGILLLFTRTHVRSCNNACTFPSPSPANGQGGSSRESGTINQLSAPGCEDHQNSLQPHRRYPPTAEMLWLCPVMDTSYQCFKTAQASAQISVEGLGTPIKQSSTKTEDLASNLWVKKSLYIIQSVCIDFVYVYCMYIYL